MFLQFNPVNGVQLKFIRKLNRSQLEYVDNQRISV